MTPYLADVATHAGIGTMFACTGACTRKLCRHARNQILLGAALVLAESAVMVRVVG